jgi:hypothetical protein
MSADWRTVAAGIGFATSLGMDTLLGNFTFVEACRLETALGRLGDAMQVQTAAGRVLGKLAGVVIDPDRLRVRYLVVHARSLFKSRRYLVPLETARLTRGRDAIEVDVRPDELQTLPSDAARLASFVPDEGARHPHAA